MLVPGIMLLCGLFVGCGVEAASSGWGVGVGSGVGLMVGLASGVDDGSASSFSGCGSSGVREYASRAFTAVS